MTIHPIEVTDQLSDAYIRYLLTSFHVNDKELRWQIQNELSKASKFVKGPFLEITSPYEVGPSLKTLINEGLLSQRMSALNQQELPIERPLYHHQVAAIRKITAGRNVVVATGTGSGKTESFLIPVFNWLFREKERDTLSAGVRAILIYPMNALANDQIKRLRVLLKDCPDITFGRYTGETPEEKGKAEKAYQLKHNGEKPLPNELLSREEMRQKPPHILITNYAMLEYLLLRPADHEFFDGESSGYWKFVVLDEAHTYSGATGIEVSMLLRRLKDRILKDKPFQGSVQCIATSATLGSGENSIDDVLQFAKRLFDEPFFWNAADPNEQDYILARRINYQNYIDPWGSPNPKAYSYLSEWIHNTFKTTIDPQNLQQFGYPNELINQVNVPQLEPEKVLYRLLHGDQKLSILRTILDEKPQIVQEIAPVLFPDFDQQSAQELLTAFVDLAVRAKDHEGDLPLLPARYHVFIRAIEGAYLNFLPKRQITLDARKMIRDGNYYYPVFEMGVCSSCGQVHLIGEEVDGKLIQRSGTIQDSERRFTAYMIVNSESLTEVDEDEQILSGQLDDLKAEYYLLCPACGTIRPEGLLDSPECCELSKSVRPIRVIKEKIIRDHQAKCHHCGAKNMNPIRLFIAGQDAATSVIATAFYQNMVVHSEQPRQVAPPTPNIEDDPLAFLDEVAATVETDREFHLNHFAPQKLLVFSDSRQDAAFFASYLDRTYQQIAWRRLITMAINEFSANADIGIDDVVAPLISLATEAQLFDRSDSAESKRSKALTILIKEFLLVDRRISPEGIGLFTFQIQEPEMIKAHRDSLAKIFYVEPTEIWPLLQELINSIRMFGAVRFPSNIDPSDPLLAPKNRQQYLSFNHTDSRAHLSSWLPSESQNRTNRRLDYLERIFLKRGISLETVRVQARSGLTNIWKFLTDQRIPKYLVMLQHPHAGAVWQLDYKHWRIVRTQKEWYQCSDCGQWTSLNVAGVCPTLHCEGTLVKKDPNAERNLNHYHRLYTELVPIRMIAKEHTAQLSPEHAETYQRQFTNAEINVLSCSTTFEMGVDVGGLEAVFMRNVPPQTANYIQRAGRAGRSRGSVAIAVTYAQRRSHDLSYFQQPEALIAGTIHSPIIQLENEKILRRHIHSIALAAFFKDNPSYFKTVEDFFRLDETLVIEHGVAVVKEFLNQRPSSIYKSLKRVIPLNMQGELGIESWSWQKELLFEERGALWKAEEMYKRDLRELHKLRDEHIAAKENSDYTLRMIKTLQDKQLLAYLSSYNVLPKYGFPVDVVDLQITNPQAAMQINLSRDLKIAISEYAPGSEVVADGRLWRSIGVRKLAKYELPIYQYIHCHHCGNYQIVARYEPESTGEHVCSNCASKLSPRSFVVPIFGFISSKQSRDPGDFRPEKRYSSRVFFSQYDDDVNDARDTQGVSEIGDISVEWHYSPRGKLAVVNSGKNAGYRFCSDCGIEYDEVPKGKLHRTPWGSWCSGHFASPIHLGHEFMSDVMEMTFHCLDLPDPNRREAFWRSLLYGILEGISSYLKIDRDDIDGCLYYRGGIVPAIVVFDNVPGGAGYTKAVQTHIPEILKETLRRMKSCTCGEETSCYGCLRNYYNQPFHDILERGLVLKALQSIY